MKANTDIRDYAKIKGVFLWEIAEKVGISEPTITRRLRRELPITEKKRFFETIDEIAAEKGGKQP